MACLNRKFVCLPEYNCPCRPRGKAVCESTMLNHRRNANKERLVKNLPLLPRGPKHSEAQQVIQQFIDHQRLLRVTANVGADPNVVASGGATTTPNSITRGNDRLSEPTASVVPEPRISENDTNHATCSLIQRQRSSSLMEGQALSRNGVLGISETNNCVDFTGEGHGLDDTTYSNVEDTSRDRHGGNIAIPEIDDGENEYGVSDSSSQENEDDELDSDSNPDSEVEQEEDPETPSLNQARFRQWAETNRKWIDLYLRRGIEQVVMDDILKTAGLGYKTWKTVVSHLCKDSGLAAAIEEYYVCDGHMCFVADSPPNEESSSSVCSECGKDKPSEGDRSATRMEYIPLLPRLRAMIRDPAKCDALFSHRREMQQDSEYKTDVFHGNIYKRIMNELETEPDDDYDIFIGASTDGFEVYKKETCNIWPIVGIIHNLPPHLRFKMQNVLPFSFVPGPKEPKNLQSFLLPLIYELLRINEGGGAAMIFPDGVWRKVRVHLLWFTGDLPAIAKVGGLVGHNGKMPCRFCLQFGYYSRSKKRYYYPSKIMVSVERQGSERGGSEFRMKVLCDLRTGNERNEEHSETALDALQTARGRTRDELRRDTGIREDSVLFQLTTMFRYKSFPIDTMHLFYNISRRLLEEIVDGRDEPYSLSRSVVSVIDDELKRSRANISSQLGARPRRLSLFRDWKASEHKDFVLSYSLVYFDGHLPELYLNGWAKFVLLVDICHRPALHDMDIENAHRLAIEFLEHYERFYFRYEADRVGLCKSVFHLLKHLAENMENCGPLINCSQLWVERYIGWVGERLHARNDAAKSLFKNALHAEAYKMYFNVPFHCDEETNDSGGDDFEILGPSFCKRSQEDDYHSTRISRLLLDYFQRKYDGMTRSEAQSVLDGLELCERSARLKFRCGSERLVAGSFSYYKEFSGYRANWYVATEMDEDLSRSDVYYRRTLSFFRVKVMSHISDELCMRWDGWQDEYSLAMMDWASGLEVGKQNQVYKNAGIEQTFRAPTIEVVTVIRRLISVLEHNTPMDSGARKIVRKRSYFVDGDLQKDHLLETDVRCEDGINRMLRGMQRTRRGRQ